MSWVLSYTAFVLRFAAKLNNAHIPFRTALLYGREIAQTGGALSEYYKQIVFMCGLSVISTMVMVWQSIKNQSEKYELFKL